MTSKQAKIQAIKGSTSITILILQPNFATSLPWKEQMIRWSLENNPVGCHAARNLSWNKAFQIPLPHYILKRRVILLQCFLEFWINIFTFLSCFIIIHNCVILLCYVFCYVLSAREKKMCQPILPSQTLMAFGSHILCRIFHFLSRVPYFMWSNFLFLLGILLILIFLFSLFSK